MMGCLRKLVNRWRPHYCLVLAMGLLVGAPFFFWGAPGYYVARSFREAWQQGHFFYFLLFTLWIHGLRARTRVPSAPLPTFSVLFILVLLLGSAIEFIQMFVDGRSFPSLDDILRNQLGCLTAFAFFIRPRLFQVRWRQRVLQVGVLMLLAFSVWPLARALFDDCAARLQFPVLADFETPFECDRWDNPSQLRRQNEYVRYGRQAARLQLSTEQYSGIFLVYFPRDWRGYQTLHFSVYNPNAAPLLLNGRIHDSHHREHDQEYQDRFNQTFTLIQGWNDLVISLGKVKAAPKGRLMDMEHIEGFGLFVARQPRNQVVYLDHIYLDR
ncbi:MAG: hypothetical protein FWD79_01820 [Desulfobulbus sp.]|nr:hypothetical protein [Desulfobulbus sp.]